VNDKIQIGCKIQSIEDWNNFFNSKEEYSTKRDSEDFKRIEAVFRAFEAYLTHLNK
jgi:hypothetical protein